MGAPTGQRTGKKRAISSLMIEPFRQVKFGLYVIGISIAFILAASYLFLSSFTDQYKHVTEIFKITDPELIREVNLDDIFFTNATRVGGLFLIFLLVMFFVVFKLTHRYYGPLVSIERFIDQIEKGDYSARVTIRSKDELQGLAAKLNKLADTLQKRHLSG